MGKQECEVRNAKREMDRLRFEPSNWHFGSNLPLKLRTSHLALRTGRGGD